MTLGEHIGKIDTLTKSVTSGRSLRRSNSETLRENTDKVGQSGTVPEKHVVVKIISESLLFAFTFNAVAVNNFDVAVFLGVVDILFNKLVFF